MNTRKIIDKATLSQIAQPELRLLISSMYNDILDLRNQIIEINNQFKLMTNENKMLKHYLGNMNSKIRINSRNNKVEESK